jgi:putative acetyltransferase
VNASDLGDRSQFAIRRFVPDDTQALCEIYYRSVHEVAIAKYDAAQVQAWAPKIPDAITWLPRLNEYDTFVATNEPGDVVGWIAMTPTGYVDMLFCLPEAIGRGVATKLYLSVEEAARERRLQELSAHASLLAQPFFAKHGWIVDNHEVVERNGVAIPRAAMSKRLAPSGESRDECHP